VEVRIHNSSAFVRGDDADLFRHIDIAACDERYSGPETWGTCDPWEPVGPEGVALLSLRTRRTAFETRGGLAGKDRNRIYGRPLPSSGRLELWAPRSVLRDVNLPTFMRETAGLELNPEDGLVLFGVQDCAGSAAKARVEIEPEGPLRFYSHGYANRSIGPEPAAMGGFVAVTPSPNVTLTAYDPTQGTEIARRLIIVKGASSTVVALLPRSRL
jgi:hypothetical protein